MIPNICPICSKKLKIKQNEQKSYVSSFYASAPMIKECNKCELTAFNNKWRRKMQKGNDLFYIFLDEDEKKIELIKNSNQPITMIIPDSMVNNLFLSEILQDLFQEFACKK